jgi:small subunit ribosomal protein S16
VSTTIRLTRMGRKKRPFYRLIVTDSRNRRDGAFLANLGYYNPFLDPFEVKLHDEEIVAWLKKGATCSDTARALMRSEGVLYRWELVRQGLDKAEIDAKVAEFKADASNRAVTKVKTKAVAAAKAKADEAAAKKAAEDAAAAEAAAAEKAAADEAAAAEKAAADEAAAEAAAAEETVEAAAEEPAAEAETEETKDEG